MIRRRVGDSLALALTAGWLMTTGAYMAGMWVALRIEGRR